MHARAGAPSKENGVHHARGLQLYSLGTDRCCSPIFSPLLLLFTRVAAPPPLRCSTRSSIGATFISSLVFTSLPSTHATPERSSIAAPFQHGDSDAAARTDAAAPAGRHEETRGGCTG
jgi:hypothetical protein